MLSAVEAASMSNLDGMTFFGLCRRPPAAWRPLTSPRWRHRPHPGTRRLQEGAEPARRRRSLVVGRYSGARRRSTPSPTRSSDAPYSGTSSPWAGRSRASRLSRPCSPAARTANTSLYIRWNNNNNNSHDNVYGTARTANTGPIYKISYDLSHDYCKLIVRSTTYAVVVWMNFGGFGEFGELKRAEISLKNTVS